MSLQGLRCLQLKITHARAARSWGACFELPQGLTATLPTPGPHLATCSGVRLQCCPTGLHRATTCLFPGASPLPAEPVC